MLKGLFSATKSLRLPKASHEHWYNMRFHIKCPQIATQSHRHLCSDVLTGLRIDTNHLYLFQATFHTYLTFTSNIFSSQNFWFFKGLSISEH